MILHLDTNQPLDECARQLGGIKVEQLFTPLTRRAPQKPDQYFAIDNGAYAGFQPKLFTNLLDLHLERRHLCRFVTVPDVPGDARRTRELFDHWRGKLNNWPAIAFVAQDGQEHLPIPWDQFSVLFIGGSTAWKMSPAALACIKTAKGMGRWVHVGRINTVGRYEYFHENFADSCDGTGLARYDQMREKFASAYHAPRLDLKYDPGQGQVCPL